MATLTSSLETWLKQDTKDASLKGRKWFDEIFPSHIWTKLWSCHHRTKQEKQVRVFLLLWLSTKIFQSCLPSKSVYLTFWPLVLRREGSAENTQTNRCSPGSDCLIWPLLVHGDVGMINKGNTVCCPPSSQSLLLLPLLLSEVPAVGFFPMNQTLLSSLFHTEKPVSLHVQSCRN